LKAAVEAGLPPTAVILNDTSHKEWSEWDFKLLKAHHLVQDWYRDGIPIWWDESDRVTFDAKARVSKSRAAIERAQESASKNNKPSPGRYFIAEPRVMDGGELPTRDEWLDEQAAKSAVKPVSKFASSNNGQIIQGRK
jgi:hypothetical protein